MKRRARLLELCVRVAINSFLMASILKTFASGPQLANVAVQQHLVAADSQTLMWTGGPLSLSSAAELSSLEALVTLLAAVVAVVILISSKFNMRLVRKFAAITSRDAASGAAMMFLAIVVLALTHASPLLTTGLQLVARSTMPVLLVSAALGYVVTWSAAGLPAARRRLAPQGAAIIEASTQDAASPLPLRRPEGSRRRFLYDNESYDDIVAAVHAPTVSISVE